MVRWRLARQLLEQGARQLEEDLEHDELLLAVDLVEEACALERLCQLTHEVGKDRVAGTGRVENACDHRVAQ